MTVALMLSGFVTFVSGAYLSENGRTEREQMAGLFGLILGAALGIAGLCVMLATLATRLPS